MASPQTENGFTKIANELLDKILSCSFSKQQIKIVFAIIRKTYGFNKKSDDISLSQLSKITQMHKTHIAREVTKLVTLGIIKKSNGEHAYHLELNKDYDQWSDQICHPLPNRSPVTKSVTKGLPNRSPSRLPNRSLQKTTIQNTIKKKGTNVPPTLQEVTEYCQSRNSSIDPGRFMDSNESKGWMVGKVKMKDWQAAVRTWERNELLFKTGGTNGQRDDRTRNKRHIDKLNELFAADIDKNGYPD